MSKQSYMSHSLIETEQLGEKLGRLLLPAAVICLRGDLGAGKTTFVRGLATGWGGQETVSSPTFTLINQYHRAESATIFFHVDCYRMDSIQDAWSAGLEDIFREDSVVALEWPERIFEIIPENKLWISFTWIDEATRTLEFDATGASSQALLEALF